MLNRNQIKYLAVAAMVIDHIAWGFVRDPELLRQIMHFIGRLTGPTMAFFLAEGYVHTRNVKKYALRLGVFAVISWIPCALFDYGRWPYPYFGVIYTLFLGLVALLVWDRSGWRPWAKILTVILLCILSVFGDWQIFDVLWPLTFFIFRNIEFIIQRRIFCCYIGCVINIIIIIHIPRLIVKHKKDIFN